MDGSLYNASAAALGLFLVLGAVDGLYLHLWAAVAAWRGGPTGACCARNAA